MNIIPKTEDTKPAVGDIVVLLFGYYNGKEWVNTPKEATVTKINRLTFYAKTEDGQSYRVGFNSDYFIGIKA